MYKRKSRKRFCASVVIKSAPKDSAQEASGPALPARDEQSFGDGILGHSKVNIENVLKIYPKKWT